MSGLARRVKPGTEELGCSWLGARLIELYSGSRLVRQGPTVGDSSKEDLLLEIPLLLSVPVVSLEEQIEL